MLVFNMNKIKMLTINKNNLFKLIQAARFLKRPQLLASLLLIAALIINLFFIPPQSVRATTSNISVDGDTSTGSWSKTGCTPFYQCIDEGTPAVTTDYINTGDVTGGAGTIQFTSQTIPNIVSTATQIIVNAQLQCPPCSGLTIGETDTLSVHLLIGGSDLDGGTWSSNQTSWPSSTSFATKTFTGSWTQSDIDAMQLKLIHNVNGAGQTASRDENIYISSVFFNVTYSLNINFEQSAYRWYANADSTDVGSALAAINTSITAPEIGTPFRLRMLIHVSVNDLPQNTEAFTLQYAQTNTCSSGTYTTMALSTGTPTTPIARYNNPTPAAAAALTTNANDPTHSGHTIRAQDYDESSTFINTQSAIASGQDGMWDFPLVITATAEANTNYCIRAIGSQSAPLNTYTVYPQLTTQARTLEMSSYRWLENSDTTDVTTFARAFGGNSTDSALSTVETSDGGFAMAGSTLSFGTSSNDFIINKVNKYGALEWTKTLGGSTGSYQGFGLAKTSDGSLYVAGTCNICVDSSTNVLVSKFNSSGVEQWSKTIIISTTSNANAITTTSDGGVVIAGQCLSSCVQGTSAFIAKFNSSGVEQWTKVHDFGGIEEINSIVETSDGGFAAGGVCGTNCTAGGGIDYQISKFNSSGVEQWSKALGGTGTDTLNSIIETSDGGLVAAGNTTSFGVTSTDFFVTKLNSSGVEQWSKTIGSTGAELANTITETSDNSLIVAGSTSSFGGGSTDILIAKLNSSGVEQWSKTVGGTGSESASSIIETSDGGLFASGSCGACGIAGGSDIFITKYQADGTILNCGSLCTSPSLTEVDQTLTETDRATSETDQNVSETDQTLTEVDQLATYKIVVATEGGATVGSTMAAQDRNADPISPAIQKLRLRATLHVAGHDMDSGTETFKLQYAERGSDMVCDASFTNETYIDMASPTGQSWTKATGASNLFTTRQRNSIASFKGSLYVFGGVSAGSTYRTDALYKSNDNGVTWSQVTMTGTAPSARRSQTMLVYDNKLWVIGGESTGYKDDVYYSSDGIAWSQARANGAANGFGGRMELGSAVMNGKMWVFGGYNGSWLSTVYSSTDGTTWTSETSMPAGRANFGYSVLNSKIWVTGGTTDGTTETTDVLSFNGTSWTTETSSPGWTKRYAHNQLSFDGKLWVLAGDADSSSTGDEIDEVWSSVNGTTWKLITDTPGFSARQLAAATVHNYKLYIAGGHDGAADDEVWYSGVSGAVSGSVGAFAYYDNPTPADGAAITGSANDPLHSSHTNVPQTYEEGSTFTNINDVDMAKDGLWDFSLAYYGPPSLRKTYCFRIVKSSGSTLNTYSAMPQLTSAYAPQQYMGSSPWWADGEEQALPL